MKDHIEIINKDGLEDKYILDEIRQIESEKGRTVVKAEFIDNGDGTATQRFWFKKKDFERIRRITGYLVGTLDRFNDAKRHEVEERVKHNVCDCLKGE